MTISAHSRALADKTQRLRNGETVVVSDEELTILEQELSDLRTVPNPRRCGIRDPYLAYRTRYPSRI